MRSLRSIFFLAVTLLLLAFVSSCGQAQQSQGSGGQGGEQQGGTIKVGLNLELSGAVATYGTNIKNGILLALEEINAAGGVLGMKLEPVVLDNASKAEEAMSVASKLVEQGVVAILGPATTGATKACIPVAMDNQVPLISPSATALDVTYDPQAKKVRDFIFRTCFTDPPQAIVAAEFAFNELGVKKAAILYDNGNDYSKGLYRVFKEEFTKLGGEIVAEGSFSENDQDFRPLLTRASQAGAELIYVPAYYGQVGKIIAQARELDIQVPMMGADGWDSPELVNLAGGADNLKDTYFTNHYSPADPSEKVRAFVQAYKAKYNAEPDAFAALGYETAYMLADAIKRAGKADPVAIKDALAATKDFEGITGRLSMDANHNPVKEVSIIAIVDGKQTLKAKKMAPEVKVD
ncbi:MAG TPA: ethanolamine utilization protein EutJ [Peptococcaceae bacterium]|nr:MAG: Amino acid/amide ABC transporter substrate-binding protein, HAAT family [Moorella sp. 60_41]HBT48170.1 ethanolamine utilization protein EutJ [Peptococcaceae bacterium]